MARVAVLIVCCILGYRTFSFTVIYEPEDDHTPLLLSLSCLVLSRPSFVRSAYGSKRKVHNVRYSATHTRASKLPVLFPSFLSLPLFIYI